MKKRFTCLRSKGVNESLPISDRAERMESFLGARGDFTLPNEESCEREENQREGVVCDCVREIDNQKEGVVCDCVREKTNK